MVEIVGDDDDDDDDDDATRYPLAAGVAFRKWHDRVGRDKHSLVRQSKSVRGRGCLVQAAWTPAEWGWATG